MKSLIHQILLLTLWQLARAMQHLPAWKAKPPVTRRLVFVTADSDHLIGSRGDEAMLLGTLETLDRLQEPMDVYLACASKLASQRAHAMGRRSFQVWGGVGMPLHFLRSLARIRPQAGLFMGADIMDGHYSPVTSMRMLIAADLVARSGVPSRFLGFSLNSAIPWPVRFAFRHIDARVQVNLRDPLSFTRHEAIARNAGQLVADAAFLLDPAAPGDEAGKALQWIACQRERARKVIGINFHPMLFPRSTGRMQTERLTDAVVQAMAAVQAHRSVSWLLIPHDDREFAGDVATLAALESRLGPELREHSYRLAYPPSAAELKTVAGATDGVFTGRMHLAIATLGQGIPVLTLAYQGKFEGLMQHFCFPHWSVLNPNLAVDPQYLTAMLLRFVDELPGLTEQVKQELPKVLKASRSTLVGIQ